MENAVCMGNAYQAGVIQGVLKNELLLSVQNTGLAIKAKYRWQGNTANKRIIFAVAPLPALNTIYGTLLTANTSIPLKEVFKLDVLVTNATQPNLLLPIFEVTNKGADFEQIAELSIPIVMGANDIELTLDIDVNHHIQILIYNATNWFLEKYPIG